MNGRPNRTEITVTTDIEYDLHQVVELPEDWETRAKVAEHFGAIWAEHAKRLGAEMGYDVDTYYGPDQSIAHDRATRTTEGDLAGYETIEERIFQAAHDSFGVTQEDVNRIAHWTDDEIAVAELVESGRLGFGKDTEVVTVQAVGGQWLVAYREQGASELTQADLPSDLSAWFENPDISGISVNDVVVNGLPEGATGVRWTDTSWTECRDHIEDASWSSMVTPSGEPTGIVLFGDVDCDACTENEDQ